MTILQWTNTTSVISKWGTFSPFSSLVILLLVRISFSKFSDVLTLFTCASADIQGFYVQLGGWNNNINVTYVMIWLLQKKNYFVFSTVVFRQKVCL